MGSVLCTLSAYLLNSLPLFLAFSHLKSHNYDMVFEQAIKAAYHSLFNRDLEHDLVHETSGKFKHILISLAQVCAP